MKLALMIAGVVVSLTATARGGTGVNVRDYGATGDGITDDRAAIQAAEDAGAGGEVYWPNGTYLVRQHPGAYWSISVPAHTSNRGQDRAGTMVVMAPNAPESVQLFQVENSPGATFDSMTLDGASSMQTVQPQRHGIFAKNSPGVSLLHVTAQHFTGDGFYFYAGSDHVALYDVAATDNDRNGLTLGGATDWTTVSESQFLRNKAQQFDSESGPSGPSINHVMLSGNTFDAQGASGDYVLTMTGAGIDPLQQSHNWTVTDNTINGPTLMVWITDVQFSRNVGINPTGKPAVRIYRACDRIYVTQNQIATTAPAVFDAGALVYITGTEGAGQSPGGVHIEGNTFTTTSAAYGISAIGARDVMIADNVITGGGAGTGVFVRATHLDTVPSAIVQRNTVTGFADWGVYLGGNGDAQISNVDIESNAFDRAMYLGDDQGTARDVTVVGNNGAAMARAPSGAVQPWGTGFRWVMQ